MAGAEAAAARCRAGVARFASVVGLKLNKLYLLEKEKCQGKTSRFGVKKGFVSVPGIAERGLAGQVYLGSRGNRGGRLRASLVALVIYFFP